MGGVQTAYADGGGWVGSVVQLELGSYGPLRFHLRLFETRNPFGAPEGTWTLGAAHFEILIPGTTNHQVMCWELAEQIVIADLVRSGLLGAAPASSGPINAAPTYRDIPAVIYNGVPDELKLACGLPPGSASGNVPIPSDGEATLLYLTGSVAVSADLRDVNFTIEFSQLIPKPFCSTGPADFLLVEGPVTLRRSTRVTTEGRYAYDAMIRGLLTATPVDVTQNPPVIVGEPFKVTASDVQQGYISSWDGNSRVAMQSQRIIIGNGAEKQFVWLEIHERGSKHYREIVQCLTD